MYVQYAPYAFVLCLCAFICVMLSVVDFLRHLDDEIDFELSGFDIE